MRGKLLQIYYRYGIMYVYYYIQVMSALDHTEKFNNNMKG